MLPLDLIKNEFYYTGEHIAPQLKNVIHCTLELNNGMLLTGTAYCGDPSKYNLDLGKASARADATWQLWPLLQMHVKTKQELAKE